MNLKNLEKDPPAGFHETVSLLEYLINIQQEENTRSDSAGCHYGTQVIKFRISKGNILQVELSEGVVGL